MFSKKKNSGKIIVNIALLAICFGIIASVSVPALKHKKKRDAYREVSDTALSITNTIEKCLGLERDSTLCNMPDKLIPYGYSAVEIELNPLIAEAEITFEDERYTVTITPPETNQKAPFILPKHDYIRETDIVDRNGRPVIESWKTNPKSGCLQQGFCS